MKPTESSSWCVLSRGPLPRSCTMSLWRGFQIDPSLCHCLWLLYRPYVKTRDCRMQWRRRTKSLWRCQITEPRAWQ